MENLFEYKRISGTFNELELPVKDFKFCICEFAMQDGGADTKQIRSSVIINRHNNFSKEIFNFSKLSYIKINYDKTLNKILGDNSDTIRDVEFLFIK